MINASRTSNSERFISIVNMLVAADDLSSDAKYRRIWESAYEILYNGSYDASMSGISAAITKFQNGPHKYFWEIVQAENLAILEEKSAIIESDSAAYIEKAGACTFVLRYFEERSTYIDASNSRLAQIKSIAEECYAQLDDMKEEHEAILWSNYELFKIAVEELIEAQGYVEKKAKYLVAQEYYYTMLIPDDTAIEYVNIYEETEDWLDVVEADCLIFIDVASVIGDLTDRDELYAQLARGYACIGSLDNTFEGVETATVTFYEVYDAYESESEAVNEQISTTVDVMCSVRANTLVFGILEYIRALFD
jgi:hypothetical protein